MICRICGSDKITRSHRRGMEKLFKYVYPRAPYRCKECWSRFWIFENPYKTTLSKAIAGSCACILILLLSWPFLPFNKKEPVQVEKKKESGSLFLARPSRTPKSELTDNDTQPKEDAIASYEETEPEAEPEPFIKQEDTAVSDLEISLQETTPETKTKIPASETQPDIAVSSLNTKQPDNKKTSEIETKSQSVEPVPFSTKKDESILSKTSVDSSAPEKKQQIKKSDTLSSDKDIKQMLQFKGIKIFESEGSVDILLKTDKMSGQHKHFFIANPAPPRIVIDLPGKWTHKGDPVFKTKSDIISQVRVGKHSDFFRIVLDMKTKKRLFPSFKDSPEGLLISVKQ